MQFSSWNNVPKTSKKKSQRQPLFPLLGVPQEDHVTHYNIYEEGLGQSHAGSLVVGSVSVSPYESWLVDSVGFFFFGVLDPSGSYNPSFPSSAGFPEHPLPSV